VQEKGVQPPPSARKATLLAALKSVHDGTASAKAETIENDMAAAHTADQQAVDVNGAAHARDSVAVSPSKASSYSHVRSLTPAAVSECHTLRPEV
jgi:ethanolamine ammonia-lyase small subunit